MFLENSMPKIKKLTQDTPMLLIALAVFFAASVASFATKAALGAELTRIAVGSTHSCGLTSGGGVLCWGEASHGQLGNGQGDMFTPSSPVPVAVAGLASGVVDLALGGVGHSCALMADGQVKCWGWNGNGQLGIGRIDAGSSTPLTVVGLGAPVTKITAGEYHTCALTAAGQMACWGNNVSGQLGGGTIEMTSSTPVTVPGLGGTVIDIAAGSSHTCALMMGGGVKCWGDNSTGQLGNGATGTGGSAPVNVTGLTSGVAALSTGGTHSCALTTGGGVKCWGNNYAGQLGNGTAGGLSSIPVDVNGLSGGVVGVKASVLASTCAVMSSGGIKCWGLNDRGQVGDGTKTNRLGPVDVVGLPPALTMAGTSTTSADSGQNLLAGTTTTVQVALGSAHTCAFTSWGNETPYQCWGGNNLGQLGSGATGADQTAPTPVKSTFHSPPLQRLAAGQQHTCALTSAGAVKCWGNNSMGQSGDGTTQPSTTPVQVVGLTAGVTGLAAGDWHTCALSPTGGIACWGQNVWGQLGNGTTAAQSNTPISVTGLTGIITGLAAGERHTCALTSAGGVQCWGDNLYGQLGNGSNNPSSTPVNVSGLTSGVTAIAAGYDHTCALTNGGNVKCWGGNLFGSLGNNSGSTSNTPVDVVGLPSAGVTAIASGGFHTCALVLDSLRNAGAMCWGSNGHGESGTGATAPASAPAPVIGLSAGITGIATGLNHSCALTAAGVLCWGYNLYGQLGDGTNTSRFTPVNVVGLEGGATLLTAGTHHTCAASGTGTSPVLCWGDNAFGQFGDGTSGNSSNVPVPSKWLTADGLVDENKGKVIIPPDLHSWIDIPPQIMTTPTVVTYTQVPSVTPPNGLQQLGPAFTLEPDDDTKLPVHMWFHSEVSGSGTLTASSGANASAVNLYVNNNGAWVPLLPCSGCSYDPATHMLTVRINAWGTYAVLGLPGTRLFLPLVVR
jgi:alpha-tubulin suppressor-like RCC1 family protein